MEKVRTVINQQTQKEILKKTRIQCLIFFILGLILFVSFLLITLISEKKEGLVFITSIIGIIFAGFLFLYGLVLSIILWTVIRKAKDDNREAECIFNEDHISVIGYQDGEQTSTEKLYYNKFTKFVLTRNYLVAFYKPGFQIVFTRSDKLIKFFLDKGIKKKKL